MKALSKTQLKEILLKQAEKYDPIKVDLAYEKAWEYARSDGVENVIDAFWFVLKKSA